MSEKTIHDRFDDNRKAWTFNAIETFGIVLLTIATIIAVWGYFSQHNALTIANVLSDFYANISSELASIVITVFVLDRLNQRRAKEDRKLELFRQAKSRSNSVAIEAVDQIQHEGWWDDFCLNNTNEDHVMELYHVQWGGADLRNLQLRNISLFGADLKKASFRSSTLVNISLQESNLENTILAEAYFENVWLEKAILTNANLERSRFSNANFDNAHCEKINLKTTYLRYASLVGANFEHANMWAVRLEYSDLSYSILSHARLSKARLKNANLFGTNLEHANLAGSHLHSVEGLDSARFNEKTVLPDAKLISVNIGGNPIYDKYWTPDTDMTRYTNPDHPDFWEPEWVKQAREDEASE